MIPRPQAIIITCLVLTACGPKQPSGPGAQVPAGGDDPDGRQELEAKSWADLFQDEQAAYYVEADDTLWLVLRLTGDADEAEVLGHVFGIIANKFDYSLDPRKHIVLIAYKGKVEQRKNYGIKVDVDALVLLQAGEITIDELTEDAGYIMNADISALKPFITK